MRRVPPWVPVAGAILLAWVPYAGLFSSAVPAGRDLVPYFYPQKNALAEAVRAGELPWIDRGRWGGVPLLGAAGASPFDPGNVLFLVLPLGAAMKAWILLRVALGVAGFAAFAKRLGAPRDVAAVAGLLYSLGGIAVSAASFPPTASGWAALPWALACAADVSREPSRLRVAKAAVAAALVLVAGIPEIWLAGAFAALVLLAPGLLGRGPDRGPARPAPALAGLAAAALIALLLAAPALVGALASAEGGVRSAGGGMNEAVAAYGAFPSARLPELAADFALATWPDVVGHPATPGYWPYFPSVSPGRVAWLLALFGFVGALRAAWRPALLASAGLALALGPATPVWPCIVRAVPLVGAVRFPEKWLFLFGLGTAWLAVLGLVALAGRLGPRVRRIALPALAAVVLADRAEVAARLLPLSPPGALEPPRALATIRNEAARGLRPRLFQEDAWHGGPTAARDLDEASRLGRERLDPNGAALFGVSYLFEPDYDFTLPRDAAEWGRVLLGAVPRRDAALESLLRWGGVRFTARAGVVRPLPEPAEPVRVARRAVFDADRSRLFRTLLAERFRADTAYLEAGPALAPPSLKSARVLSVADRASGLAVDVAVGVAADGGDDVALLQVFRLRAAIADVTIDGRAAALLPSTGGFGAVAVPAGRHRVLLRPRTSWVKIAAVTSGLAAFALLAAVAAGRRPRAA